jgi:hypothetical protein
MDTSAFWAKHIMTDWGFSTAALTTACAAQVVLPEFFCKTLPMK